MRPRLSTPRLDLAAFTLEDTAGLHLLFSEHRPCGLGRETLPRANAASLAVTREIGMVRDRVERDDTGELVYFRSTEDERLPPGS